mgnify:CR=1 FL=1
MASIFTTGQAPIFTAAQQELSTLAIKPNTARLELQVSGAAFTAYVGPKGTRAEIKKAASKAKAAATRAAKKAAKSA